jgi:hypothetical protein
VHRSFIALLFVATTALAQPVLIEKIDVNSDRAKPNIIRAETRLVAGRSYTSEQLDQALYRVRRLPFVVDATFALRPGGTPDARVLIISVVEQPMFNYDLDVQGVAVRNGYVASSTGLGLRFFPGSGALDLSAGGQQYAYGGGSGISHFGDIAATYTAYGLFGTAAYAGVGIRTGYNAKHRIISPLLLLGVPLTQKQTLRGMYVRSGGEYENNSLLAAQWLYETSDDPFFARRGLDVAAGPQWQKLFFEADYNVGRPIFFHVEDIIRSRGFAASAAKYWPWAEHSALWAQAGGSAFLDQQTNNGRRLNDTHRQFGDLTFGVAHNFDGWRGGDSFRRLRLEVGAGYHLDRTRTGSFTEDFRSGPELFTGLAYRSRVGVVRIGVSYVNPN